MKDGTVILAAILFLQVTGALAQDELAVRGKAVSEAHCTRCHVVGDFNPGGGISSTPSFQMMVNALPDWEERFLTFFDRNPHPSAVEFTDTGPLTDSIATMVRVVIELEDVEAIAAFAATLRE